MVRVVEPLLATGFSVSAAALGAAAFGADWEVARGSGTSMAVSGRGNNKITGISDAAALAAVDRAELVRLRLDEDDVLLLAVVGLDTGRRICPSPVLTTMSSASTPMLDDPFMPVPSEPGFAELPLVPVAESLFPSRPSSDPLLVSVVLVDPWPG